MRKLVAFAVAAPLMGLAALMGVVVVAVAAMTFLIGAGGEEENSSGSGGARDCGPSTRSHLPSENALADIPADYLQLYIRAAANHEGFDWTYLASIGKQESNHGRNPAAFRPEGSAGSSVPGREMRGGAQGPMQFMPSTWSAYEEDYSGDGVTDVFDPADAIPAAAAYLVAHGAPQDWDQAILGYIGPTGGWYVTEVKQRAAEYRGAAAANPDALLGDGTGDSGTNADNGEAGAAAAPLSCAPAAAGTTTTDGALRVESPDGVFHGPLPEGPLGEAMKIFASKMGSSYVWGATGPDVFDCSGLVYYALSQAGYPDGRMTADGYFRAYPPVPAGQEQPGDLVLFSSYLRGTGQAGHIGMVLNPAEHTMMHTYTSGAPATVSTYDTWDGGPVGFVRVPPMAENAAPAEDPGMLLVGGGG